MNILIIGAGRLGLKLANQLSQLYIVTLVSRSQKHCNTNITQIIKDAKQLSHTDFNHSFQAVFVILSPDTRTCDDYYQTYTSTCYPISQAVLNNKHQQQPPHVFYISSTGVFGENQGEIISCHTLPNPQTKLACILYASELLYQAFFKENCTIIRPVGLLYQNDDIVNRSFMQKNAISCDKIDTYHYTNWIEIDLVVDKLIKLLHTNHKKSVYLFSQTTKTRHEIYNAIRQKLQLPALAIDDNLPITGKQVIDTPI